MNKLYVRLHTAFISLTFYAAALTQAPPLNQYQLFHTWVDSSGNQIPITAQNKYYSPVGTMRGAKLINASHLRLATKKNHPRGADLFPSNPEFAAQLDDFLTNIESDTYFLVYFSRLHLVILHELYSYLMKVYTTFNMTITKDLETYLRNEPTQALNRKTLIINHLLGIIEAQSNQAIRARMPALPQHLATYAGNTLLLNHDYGADLNLLIEKQELQIIDDPVVQQSIKNMRNSYLTTFGKYLLFFRNYTSSLSKLDKGGESAFLEHAQLIKRILSARTPTFDKKSSLKDQIKALREINLINPLLFLYDDETLRSTRIIQRTAQTLQIGIEKVNWPSKVVQDAENPQPLKDKNGIVINSAPPAFFTDAKGNRTTSKTEASRLYVNIPTLQHLFTQQIIPQPNWLNSTRGIMLMLRACLGDFTALFDPIFQADLILDPCIRCIIINSGLKVGISFSATQINQICTECQEYLDALQKLIKQQQQELTPPPPPPLDPDLPPPT